MKQRTMLHTFLFIFLTNVDLDRAYVFIYVIGLETEWITRDNEAGIWQLEPLRDTVECVRKCGSSMVLFTPMALSVWSFTSAFETPNAPSDMALPTKGRWVAPMGLNKGWRQYKCCNPLWKKQPSGTNIHKHKVGGYCFLLNTESTFYLYTESTYWWLIFSCCYCSVPLDLYRRETKNILRCHATANWQNIFHMPWHRFSKAIYPNDIFLQLLLWCWWYRTQSTFAPKSAICVQLAWDLVIMKAIACDLWHTHHTYAIFILI